MVKKLESITKNNKRNEIIENPGGFASIFDLGKLKYKDPILLSSTDGVGTKLKIAVDAKNLKFLGFDLVAMCVNDILANGGEPLFFLDYISSSNINEKDFLELMQSINLACKNSGCSLVGGETAEMPGIYKKNEFDLAGFSVGVVERKNLLKKENVKKDSILIGLNSNGFHSNGFSLIRKILKKKKISLNSKTPYKSNKKKISDDLLKPTRIYVNEILPLIKKGLISAIAHITGGGIFENLERIIPDNLYAEINSKKHKIPESFLWLKSCGRISAEEMLKTFNCGLGLIIVVEKKKFEEVIKFLKKNKTKFQILGKVLRKKNESRKIEIKNFGKWNLT